MSEGTSSGTPDKEHGLQRVLLNLHKTIENGDYYEAHQMYRTLYARYMSQKKYENAINIVFEGATLFLEIEEVTSGVDLADLYLDSLVESRTESTEELFDKIVGLFKKMDIDTVERNAYLRKAIKWSTSTTKEECLYGHPYLHKSIAEISWKQNNVILARHHYLYSSDGCGYAMMLIELHMTRGYPTEIDLFIAQVVLQYLCLKKKNTAIDAFECYVSQHPNIGGPPYIWPLLNFICYLLQSLENGKLIQFKVLMEKYRFCIQRDPLYINYLRKIALIFFDMHTTEIQNQIFFGNMFQNIFGIVNEVDLELGNNCPMFDRSDLED